MNEKEAYDTIVGLAHDYWDKGFEIGRLEMLNDIKKIISDSIQNCSMRGDIALSDLLREVEKLG
jgi:hypothetical protein